MYLHQSMKFGGAMMELWSLQIWCSLIRLSLSLEVCPYFFLNRQ